MTDVQAQTITAKPPLRYTLSYGMRLDKIPAPDVAPSPVSVTLPDGSAGRMTLQVTNGTADEIKAQLLHNVDVFFQEYASE